MHYIIVALPQTFSSFASNIQDRRSPVNIVLALKPKCMEVLVDFAFLHHL